MVTLSDIARKLGIDVSVVSRALNPGRVPHPIRKETQELVIETAKAMGYRPNRQASFLKKGAAATIFCLMPDIGHRVVADLVYGISEAAAEAAFPVNFFFYREVGDYLRFFKMLESVPHAAVICYAFQEVPKCDNLPHDTLPLMPEEIRGAILGYSRNHSAFLLLNLESNLDLTGDDEVLKIPRIEIDEFAGGRKIAEHLLECGCRRFIYSRGTQRFPLRENGFSETVRKHGFECEKATRDGVKTLNRAGIKTGIFAETDFLAYGWVGFAREEHIALGKNILLVGYDDITTSMWMTPSISTIHQPTRKEGHLAVKKVLECLSEPKRGVIYLEPEIVVRETTGGKRNADDLLCLQ